MKTKSWLCWSWQLVLAGCLGLVGDVYDGLRLRAFAQQVTADPTLLTTVTDNGNSFEITGGTTVGGRNLFHSFSSFDVPDGSVADFLNNPAIANIFSRVTGGTPSDIQGLIRARGNANLFLLNPSGIIFGQNAQLDIGGSFVATTANAIAFPGGGEFSLTSEVSPNNSLLSVNPSAFLFSQLASGSIVNVSRAIVGFNQLGRPIYGLRVPNGESLLLLGGDVNINGGGLNAFGGHIELGGVKGLGTVELNIKDSNLSLNFASNVMKADVLITDGARVDVADSNGGQIAINANDLSIFRSLLIAGIFPGTGEVDSQAGDITLNATEVVTIANSFIFNAVNRAGFGNGGNINIINAESLFIRDGAQLNTGTYAQGNAGDVNIDIRGAVVLNGENNNLVSTGISSAVQNGAVGKGGDINIKAGSLSLNRAGLVTSTYGQGDAGNVNINVRDALTANQVINLTNIGIFPSGVFSTVESGAVGHGGNITIQAGSLSLIDSGQIQTLVRRSVNGLDPGKGDAGNININVLGAVTFDGVNDGLSVNEGLTSGIASAVDSGTVGNGGNITINAASVSITDSAQINATSLGQGNAGDVSITVHDTLQAINSNISTISNQSSGGVINITAKDVRLSGDSNIATNVFSGAGNGGNITLTANSIIAFDDSDIVAFAQDGKGGDITFNTPAFFGFRYQPAPQGTNPVALDGNNRVDINASGAVSGVITLPDVAFIQNSLADLQQNPIDTNALIANSCIARSSKQEGTFSITGAGGLPYRPGDASASTYPTGTVRGVNNNTNNSVPRPWKIGDRIIEPSGVYRLANGQLVMSRECR